MKNNKVHNVPIGEKLIRKKMVTDLFVSMMIRYFFGKYNNNSINIIIMFLLMIWLGKSKRLHCIKVVYSA